MSKLRSFSNTFRGESGYINWIGEGFDHDHCKNPRLVMQKAKVHLHEMLNKVVLQYDEGVHGRYDLIFPQNTSYWKFTTNFKFGSCYTFFTPYSQVKGGPLLKKIKFYMKNNVQWQVHSPGIFLSRITARRQNLKFYNISGFRFQQYDLSYKVYKLLDYMDEPCDPNHAHQNTLGQKSTFYPKIHILKIPIFTKFTFLKSHFSQNSHF